MAHFTPAQITELKSEFAKPEYAGMDFVGMSLAFNAKTYDAPQDIPRQAAIEAMVFTASNDWGELVGVVNGTITATLANRKRATNVREVLTLGELFNSANDGKWTKFISLIDNLVSASIITLESKTNLVALRTRKAPLWSKYLSREFDWTDVKEVVEA